MHVLLGRSMNPEKYPVGQYIAYFRRVKRDFDAASTGSGEYLPRTKRALPTCARGTRICDKRRRNDDHLSLVAGISRNHRKALVARDVTTVASLSQLDLAATPKLDGIGKPALLRIHEQARLQVQGRDEGHLVYELLNTKEPDQGLAALPAPSPGDLFLDLEGDSYAFETGIEYLFGVLTLPEEAAAEPSYESLWSFDRTEEKKAFEKFIAMVMERWHRYPDMHIYHYAAYEPTAIKRLAGQHAVCIDEVDQLLRAGIFVDLYRVVRQGVRASVESYSIKKLEPLYGFNRAVSARDSVLALQTFGAALALGDAHDAGKELLAAIESYNRDDCLSAWQLREWLEERRLELEAKTGKALSRPALKQGEAPEELSAKTQQVRAVMARLVAGLPEEESEWTSEQRALWLLAQMLEYHRREDKSSWWEYFRQCDLSDDELLEDRSALGGLTYVGTSRSGQAVHRPPIQLPPAGPRN